MLSEAAKRYGTDEPPAPWRTLSAGPLTAELEGGQLRYLRFDGVEVLRGISFLVRDRFWGTFAAELSAVSIVEQSGRFVVSYAGRCEPQGGDLRYEVDIVGDATGRLTFRSWGVPVRDFVTNRTGFVVLHPLASLAGAEVELEHTDGRDETVRLPEWISPHEPAQDLFALTHRTRGLTVRVEMTGDAYDMEDQRNWTDASFKTYIRPLSKPKPYTLAAGERFEQSVTVIVSGKVDRRAAAEVRTTEWMTLPEIGLATETPELPVERFAWLKHLIGRPSAPEEVAPMVALAARLGAKLELQFAIPAVDPGAELAAWAAARKAHAVLVAPWRLWPMAPTEGRGAASLEDIARAARAAFPGVTVGGGVLTGFTEFNRNRMPLESVDYAAHATTAIVHAADDRSVVESLEALPHVFGSARALVGACPYRVGPAGIGMALNPDGPPRFTQGGRNTMVRNDPRQLGLFAAAWTLGYAAQVLPFGVEVFSPGFANGDLGLLEGDALRPVYHIVRALALAAGQNVRRSAAPAGCVGLEFSGTLWIANLSGAMVEIGARGAAVLDVPSFETAAGDEEFFDRPKGNGSVRLGPFAVARVWQ